MRKSALITGSAKRIGKEISLHLSKIGYNIALHFNSSEEDALDTQKYIINNGGICKIYKADFSIENEVLSLFSNVKNDFNNIDLLINNASIFERFNLKESSIEFINKIIEINLKAPLLLIKEFANQNICGNIINILDSKIFKNDNNYFLYALTKKSLAYATKMAALEFSPNIRVNGIALGLIINSQDNNKKKFENFIDKIPLKREGEITNILHTIDFILENNYLTGEIISIDGGMFLK